jgi:signal transduction histidine kinase
VNPAPLAARLRRPWPQTIRTRLALLYAGLFLAAGSALLALTFGLVASSLPAASADSANAASKDSGLLEACSQAQAAAPGQTKAPDAVLAQCKQAFDAGARAGSRSQRDRTLGSLLLFSLVGLGVMTLASGGLGWIVAGRVLRPVRAITEAARRASEQHLGERLALPGPSDELKELADTFDDMLERLDRAFASQRRFVANASHELRTPLTVVRTAVDVTLAKPSRTSEQVDAMGARIRRSIDRAERTIDALLTLAVSDQRLATRELVDLATVAEDTLDSASTAIARLGLRVETSLGSAGVSGDPFLLERMVANLVDNAVRHNHPGGWIHVRCHAGTESAVFEISNSGPFVPEEAIPSLLEPFGRAEARISSRDGVGLGLSIVSAIAIAHDASVVAHSRSGGGLDVCVSLAAHHDNRP